MKYLKKFNEALERDVDGNLTTTTLDEIKDYCELNLAYLLDLGMGVKCSDTIDDSTGIHECGIELSFNKIHTSIILDHVIPFFKRIKNVYQLGTWIAHNANFLFHCNSGSQYFISFEELDNIESLMNSSPSTQRNIKAGFDIHIEKIFFYIIDEK